MKQRKILIRCDQNGERYGSVFRVRLTQSNIVINSPVSDAWKVIDNTPGFVDWFPGVKWAKMEDEQQKGLGAKRLAQLDGNKYYEEIIAV